MAISRYPASVFLPKLEEPFPTIHAYLCRRFPRVTPECWEGRMSQGKVLWEDGSPVAPDAPYLAERRISYFREVEDEPVIPFQEKILFQNDHILVCCKPHFLPVTPGGRWVQQCLVHRLRSATGIDDLVPMHRIDRDTAGIVLFSTNRETRGRYSRLFANGLVDKSYLAVSAGAGQNGTGDVGNCPTDNYGRGNGTSTSHPAATGRWQVENRIVSGEPWYRMRVEPGTANARSRIELLASRDGLSRFRLIPETGKTHQLRLHMSGLGFPILNDRLYPALQDPGDDDFDRPLQLLAHRLAFRDPLTDRVLCFQSERQLLW